MTEGKEPPRAGTRWSVVALAIFAGIFAAMQIGKVPPAMPVLGTSLAMGLAAVGWIASIFNAIGAILGVPAGALSDGLGHRRVLMASLAFIALGSLLGGLSDAFAPLLLTRLIEGIGYLGIIVSAPSLIIEAALPKDHALALGLWSTFLPTGFALMVVIAPAFIETVGWPGLWFLNAGLMGAYLVLFSLATRNAADLPNARPEPPTVRLGPAFRVATLKGPLVLALIFVAYALQWSGLSNWMPTFFAAQGYGLGLAALLSALVIFMNAPGNLLGAWLLHRGVSRSVLVSAGTLAMGILALGVFGDAVPGVVKFWLALAFSLLGGVVPPAVVGAVPSQAPSPSQVGAVNGLVMQGNNIGFLLGAPLVGATVTLTGGWQATGWLVLLVGTCGFLLGLVFRRIDRTLPTA